MADAEFDDPRRKELLQALKDALPVYSIIPLTTWACLWLSDINMLENIVTRTQEAPAFTQVALEGIGAKRIVPICMLLAPIPFNC
jgi:hypothetical protein